MARYAKFFSLGGGGGTNNLQLPVGTILDATLRQVQDGLGTGSPLYLSTRRVGITSDSSVTTQTSSVIQATTTNANLVISPNGTGALIAQIPDGTATGGNARGANAVDLQMKRNTADQVAGPGEYAVISGGTANRNKGPYGFIGGGIGNAIDIGGAGSNYTSNVITGGTVNLIKELSRSSVICGGWENTINSAENSVIGGGRSNNAFNYISHATIGGGQGNSVSSNHSTISGGQSNTASTGTHATVVGGQSNTASGFHATVVGGQSNTSSGQYAVSGGFSNTASNYGSTSFGSGNNASGNRSFVAGGDGNSASGNRNIVLAGQSNQAISDYSVASGIYALTYLAQQRSIGNRYDTFGNPSDSQISDLIACRLAILNTGGTTVLSLDGSGVSNLIIPRGNNRLWAVKVVATAFVSVAGGTLVLGDSYMGEFTLLFKRVGGTSSVVGVNAGNIIYDTNMATAAFTFAAGASQDLQITFKAPTTASATTFRCVAKVELVEVAY
jgi:hypothetical protein